jgi:hypothetical protein
MSDEEYAVNQGDTDPALVVTLYDRADDGTLTPVNLTGATIRVHGVDPRGGVWSFVGEIFGDPLLGKAGRTWALTPTNDTASILSGGPRAGSRSRRPGPSATSRGREKSRTPTGRSPS